MGIVGTRRPWHFTSQGPEKSLNAPCPICYAGSMIILQYFFLLLLALYAWAVLNPMAARTFVAGSCVGAAAISFSTMAGGRRTGSFANFVIGRLQKAPMPGSSKTSSTDIGQR